MLEGLLRAERVLKVDPQSDCLDVRAALLAGNAELPVADAEHVDRTEGRAHRPLHLAVDVLGLARDALVRGIEGAPRRRVVVGDDVPGHLLDEDRRVSTGFASPPSAGIATSATPTTATTVTTKATTEPMMTPRDTRGSFPEALILQVGAEVVSGHRPGARSW